MSAHAKVEVKQDAALVQTPTPALFGTLQRKCACGGSGGSSGSSGASGSSGECSECRKKKILQRRAAEGARPAVAPPIVHEVLRSSGRPLDAATRVFLEPRFGHRFSRIRVNAPRGSSVRLPEFGSLHRLYQGNAGETGCDVSVGKPQSELHSPSPCYAACTARHEALHVTDLTPCCAKANQKYKAATTDEQKTAVQDKMNDWSLANQDYLECRAYGESVRCAREFLAAHCASSNAETPDGPSSSAQTQAAATPNAAAPSSGQDQASPESAGERLPEAAPLDNKPADTPPNPEICCSTVKEYARVQGLRRDNFCSTAKKGLTNCPF
jgi:hypothetical protein